MVPEIAADGKALDPASVRRHWSDRRPAVLHSAVSCGRVIV